MYTSGAEQPPTPHHVLRSADLSLSWRQKQRKAQAKAKEEGRAPVVYAIDPLLAALAHFDTSEDLSKRIRLLYRVLDVDDNGISASQAKRTENESVSLALTAASAHSDADAASCTALER